MVIRYDGQEYIAADGIVEGVELRNEFDEFPGTWDDPFGGTSVRTGRKELTITLRSPVTLRGQPVPDMLDERPGPLQKGK